MNIALKQDIDLKHIVKLGVNGVNQYAGKTKQKKVKDTFFISKKKASVIWSFVKVC